MQTRVPTSIDDDDRRLAMTTGGIARPLPLVAPDDLRSIGRRGPGRDEAPCAIIDRMCNGLPILTGDGPDDQRRDSKAVPPGCACRTPDHHHCALRRHDRFCACRAPTPCPRGFTGSEQLDAEGQMPRETAAMRSCNYGAWMGLTIALSGTALAAR
jgi:hypothetical protein